MQSIAVVGLKGYHTVAREPSLPPEEQQVEKHPLKDTLLEEETDRMQEARDSLNLMRFIDPPFSVPNKPSVKGSEYLKMKYSFREKMLVAVIGSHLHANRMETIYDTWARSVSQVMFFTGSDGHLDSMGLEGLPVVQLPGITDDSSAHLKMFAVLKHLSQYYSNKYNWFMRVSDTAYVRGHKLEELLSKMDPNEKVYLGHPVLERTEGNSQLKLLPHESYCKGGPGVVLSRAALQALSPYLDLCMEAVQKHNQNSTEPQWNREDVELGRCVSRTIKVQCLSGNATKVMIILRHHLKY